MNDQDPSEDTQVRTLTESTEEHASDLRTRRFARVQLWTLVSLLTVAAVSVTLIERHVLGVPWLPGEDERAWRLEVEITCDAAGGPVEVSLAIPARVPEYRIIGESASAEGFGFRISEGDSHRRAVWTTRAASGPQTLFYSVAVHDVLGRADRVAADRPRKPEPAVFADDRQATAGGLVDRAYARSAEPVSLTAELIERLNRDVGLPEIVLIQPPGIDAPERTRLLIDLLSLRGVAARVARGVQLEDGARRQPLKEMLEVFDGTRWAVVDPMTGGVGIPPRLVLLQRGGASLLDVTGATRSRIRLSAIETVLPARQAARERGREGSA